MARINWHGKIINADVVKQLEDGDWHVQALHDGLRFVKGTILRVRPSEFIDGPPTPATAAPPPADDPEPAQSDPQPTETDETPEKIPENQPRAAAPPPDQPPGAPLMVPMFTFTTKDPAAMSRLSDKLRAAAGVAGAVTAELEAQADAILARKSELEDRGERVFAPHKALLNEANAGLDEVEKALAPLTNGGPAE